MGEPPAELLDNVVANSPMNPKYATAVDRESAYEMLAARHAPQASGSAPASGSMPASTTQATKKGNRKSAKPESGLAEQILGNSVTKSMLRAGATAARPRSCGRSSRRRTRSGEGRPGLNVRAGPAPCRPPR
jgi:DNA double-strand break repair helicase HerA and related ATPase